MNRIKKYSKVSLSIFGTVDAPPGVSAYNELEQGGLTVFLSNIIRLIMVMGGVYAVFNFILAGLAYMSAGGDPKKIADAGSKIYMSMVGLVVMLGSLLIAAMLSWILFGDYQTLLSLSVFGP